MHVPAPPPPPTRSEFGVRAASAARRRRGLVAVVGLVGASGCAPEGDDGARYEAGEELPGGDTTNTLLFGNNALSMPAANITAEHESRFFSGNSFFNQAWVQAPSSTMNRDGLGPLFNARSCAACHFRDGRGAPPIEEDEAFVGVLFRLSVPGAGPHGEALPEPSYGGQLQPFSIDDVPPEGRPTVTYTPLEDFFGDGEPYTLLAPSYRFEDLAYGPLDPSTMVSPRVAPAVVGLGLLEAIPESRLRALADPDDVDGDGISGRVNEVWDVAAGAHVVGRFGWKAEQPSVRQQSAAAFLGDVGVTTSLFPNQACTPAQPDCAAAIEGGTPELADDLLDRVETYGQLLAVPARDRYDDAEVLRGKALFGEVGCADCHVPAHTTDPAAALAEVRDQRIWPYTDLLLHDMGDGLADGRPSYDANGREWRTPPLWGLRFYEIVNGHDRLLHDGRARGVEEAILWHGGEARSAMERYRALPADARNELLAFVEAL